LKPRIVLTTWRSAEGFSFNPDEEVAFAAASSSATSLATVDALELDSRSELKGASRVCIVVCSIQDTMSAETPRVAYRKQRYKIQSC
jgi:hypothetical protein